MSFPAYKNYRDSGEEWLGAVPAHWNITRLKNLLAEVDERAGNQDLELLGLSKLAGVVRRSELSQGAAAADDYGRYKVVQPGQLVMNKMQAWNGVFAISPHLGIVSPDYSVFDFLADGYEAFICAALRTDLAAGELFTRCRGMGTAFLRLNTGDLLDVRMALPPVNEAVAIAAFLDRETAKIDALVEEQRRLIELLKEKRQAVISQAVTKGLDPTMPTKDSGAEWLGEVPAHWQVMRLKRHVSVLSGYAFPSSGFSMNPSDTRLLRGVNVAVGRTRWDDVVFWPHQKDGDLVEFELKEGDIVLGMDRPWIGDGLRVAQIIAADLPCLLLQRVTALRPAPGLLPAYLQFLLAGEAFYHHCVPDMTGVSVPHISPTQVGDFIVALPPPEEQLAILESIGRSAAAFEPLIFAANEAIELLSERRAALISAAVTGKIDVREAAEQQAEAA